MSEIVDLDAARIAPFLRRALEGFLADQPASEFQRGYLAAIVVMLSEGLRADGANTRALLAAAEHILSETAP